MGFRSDLERVLNTYTQGCLKETPDGILAELLKAHIKAWDTAVLQLNGSNSKEKFRKEAKVMGYQRLA